MCNTMNFDLKKSEIENQKNQKLISYKNKQDAPRSLYLLNKLNKSKNVKIICLQQLNKNTMSKKNKNYFFFFLEFNQTCAHTFLR